MSKEKLKFAEPHLLTGLSEDAPILVALSGGADSSALLHLLVEYGKKTGSKIVAAHLNHGIRGEEYAFEADRDENFCRALCESFGIELFIKKLDIPALSQESHRSVETEAREARYAFFTEIMREKNIKILATAHNADDNLETQLFNLCRGCGTEGLVGIPETRRLDEVTGGVVIRPILKAEKRDIISYCKQNGIRYVTDSTNLETDYTRNGIRHKVIPALSEIFPSAKRNAKRLSLCAAEDSDFILTQAREYLCSHKVLYAKELTRLHPSLLKRVLKIAYGKVSRATLEAVHLEALISLIASKKNGSAISLPDKKQATIIDGILCFGDEQREHPKTLEPYSQWLDFGVNIIENTDFAVALVSMNSSDTPTLDGYALYSSARVKLDEANSLIAKSRTCGAFVTDGGVNKKIKKLMCDKKVPLSDRDTLPLIYSDETVLYVPLCAVGDSVKARSGHRHNTTIYVYKKHPEE